MRQYEYENVKRIDKRTARRLYWEGKIIYLLPCKVRWDSWMKPYQTKRTELDDKMGHTLFDYTVNEFEFYNCQYNEIGKYTAFYVKEEEL